MDVPGFFLAACHLTKQRSLDRGVGQTGTLGSRCGGLRPALTSCPHGPAQQVGGLLRWRKCDVHMHQTCPEALLPAWDYVSTRQSTVPTAGQKTPSARGAGKGPGGVRSGGPSAALWLVRSSEPRSPH